MPHIPKIEAVEIPSKRRIGQKPLTKFVDWINAIDVKLIDYPNPDRNREKMYLFQRATWGRDLKHLMEHGKTKEQIEANIKLAFSGKSLHLNIETPDFAFAIGGISRILTHQVVRDRIGVTYSQRCSGDQDIRMDDCLVPRSLARDPDILDRYIKSTLESKMIYSESVDREMPQSIQAMRMIIPQNLAQYILCDYSLMTLMNVIGKRGCTNETLEYNVVSDKMSKLVIEKFPELSDVLKPNCDKGGCFFMKGRSPLNGNIYLPDEKHDFDYNKANFMYDNTRAELLDGPEFATRYFYGKNEIEKEEFDETKKEYDKDFDILHKF